MKIRMHNMLNQAVEDEKKVITLKSPPTEPVIRPKTQISSYSTRQMLNAKSRSPNRETTPVAVANSSSTTRIQSNSRMTRKEKVPVFRKKQQVIKKVDPILLDQNQDLLLDLQTKMFDENEDKEPEKIADAMGHLMDFVKLSKSFVYNQEYYPVNCSICKEKIDTNLGYHKCEICQINHCMICASKKSTVTPD